MKTHMKITKQMALVGGALAAVTGAQASTDYGPAIWRQACSSHWYTSGNYHHFCVIHDMEGYYASTISYLQGCNNTVSIYYCVNGKQDTSTDYAAGEVTQMVREVNYAWHAGCWNTYMWGTEHEGFVSNPAWFTDAMYNATIPLQKHLVTAGGVPVTDRNHIIGHNEHNNANWRAWVTANYAFSPTCNSHTDPGSFFNWSRLMTGMTGGGSSVIIDNSNAGFGASAGWATGSSSTDKYGADYRFHSTAPTSDRASWTGSPSGTHTAYAWYAQGSNRSTTAPYSVVHGGTSTTVDVNQQTGGGTWVSLGSYGFNAGEAMYLSYWTGTGFIVVADAVKWQ